MVSGNVKTVRVLTSISNRYIDLRTDWPIEKINEIMQRGVGPSWWAHQGLSSRACTRPCPVKRERPHCAASPAAAAAGVALYA